MSGKVDEDTILRLMARVLVDDDDDEEEPLEGELLPPGKRRVRIRYESIEKVLAAVPKLMMRARWDLNLSQERLADQLGFDRTYPSLIERGLRRPSLRTFITLALGLNQDPVKWLQQAINYAANPDELIVGEPRRPAKLPHLCRGETPPPLI